MAPPTPGLPFFRDIWLKLFAVALAVLLRLAVAGDPTVERGLHVPLEFENRPSSIEVLGDPPDTVEVRLRGSSGVLRRLETGDVAAIIDLGAERPGQRLFDMTEGRVRAPLGVEVTQVIPSSVSLLLEAEGSPRLVPIVPVVSGTPADGFMVGQVTVEPATVEVVGPLSRLRELTDAITEAIDVTDASVPIAQSVTVGVEEPNLRLETPVTALVSVDIVRAPVARTLSEVPVSFENLGPGLTVSLVPDTVSVSIRGAIELMRGLDAGLVDASVDLAGLEAGRYNLSIKVEPHRAFEITDVQPDFVSVWLR